MSTLRAGIVCDYAEEGWPSMDLVADMLIEHLSAPAHGIAIRRIRPAMPRSFSRIPGLASNPAIRNLDRLAGRFWHYPRSLRHSVPECEVFHLVDHSYSQLVHCLPAARTVVTFHDLDTFRCLLEPVRDPRPYWFRKMAERILTGFQKAARIVCVSETSRKELASHRIVDERKTLVIANGAHPGCTMEPDPAADAQLARLAPAIASKRPVFLHVGSTIPRKNIEGLLRIFAALRSRWPSAILLRAGGSFTTPQRALAAELGLCGAIHSLPFIERELLTAAYQKADLLLLPSHSEGFGLPLIEAMSCGCPAIASGLEVFREVGGTEALYCDAADPEQWVAAMEGVLQKDRWLLSRRLASYAARFSWVEAARATAALYRTLSS